MRLPTSGWCEIATWHGKFYSRYIIPCQMFLEKNFSIFRSGLISLFHIKRGNKVGKKAGERTGFWSECDNNWSFSLDGALHTTTELTSVHGGWADFACWEETCLQLRFLQLQILRGDSHVTANAQHTVKSCGFSLLYKSFLVSFHQSSKILSLFICLALCASGERTSI